MSLLEMAISTHSWGSWTSVQTIHSIVFDPLEISVYFFATRVARIKTKHNDPFSTLSFINHNSLQVLFTYLISSFSRSSFLLFTIKFLLGTMINSSVHSDTVDSYLKSPFSLPPLYSRQGVLLWHL